MGKRASHAAGNHGVGVSRHVAACALALAIALPAPARAQDLPDGRQITFGIDTRLVAQQNADLIPGGTAQTIESNTRLSFGFRTETPASFLSLDASARLRLIERIDGGAGGVRSGITDPRIALAFRREAATSFVAGTAFWLTSDLSRTDLVQDPGLDPTLPPVGTRRVAGGTLTYRWGEDRRAGFGITASYADTAYTDAPGLIDNRRASLGADVRLDLTEVTRLTIGLTRSRFDPVGGAGRDTTALTGELSIDRPRGPLTFSANITETPEGTRAGLTVGRMYELTDGTLSGSFGVSRGVAGDIGIVGALAYTRDLPDGRISASLSRRVTTGEDDRETTETRAILGYGRELTDRTRIILDLGAGESVASATGIAIRFGTIGATLSHELDRNWVVDAGYRFRLREVTGQPAANNSAVFVGLRRQFVTSY